MNDIVTFYYRLSRIRDAKCTYAWREISMKERERIKQYLCAFSDLRWYSVLRANICIFLAHEFMCYYHKLLMFTFRWFFSFLISLSLSLCLRPLFPYDFGRYISYANDFKNRAYTVEYSKYRLMHIFRIFIFSHFRLYFIHWICIVWFRETSKKRSILRGKIVDMQHSNCTTNLFQQNASLEKQVFFI